MFGRSEQASPIYEGVVEIQINSHHVRKKPDNMTHVIHEGNTSGHLLRQLSKSRAGPTVP
jgi:hypothetical protein